MTLPLPKIPAMAQRMSDTRYFTATIQVVRTKGLETDSQGDKRTTGERTIAEIPGRIVRGSDPIEIVQAERVTPVKHWEIRLSLSALEALRKERGCFEIQSGDKLRDKASGQEYLNNGDDNGRTEASYLSVFCVQVG